MIFFEFCSIPGGKQRIGMRLHSLCITWGEEDFFGGYKNFQDEIGGIGNF